MSNLREIIEKSDKSPTIINENSNFVVVTYWWGRGNLNTNTARPCISFYESIVTKMTFICMKIFSSTPKNKMEFVYNNIEQILLVKSSDTTTPSDFEKLLTNKAKQYQNMVYNYCKIDELTREPEKTLDIKALKCLEDLKKNGKTPETYEFKTIEYIETQIKIACILWVQINKILLFKLFDNKKNMKDLKQKYIESRNDNTNHEDNNIEIKERVKSLIDVKNKLVSDMKSNLNKPFVYDINYIDKLTKMGINISEYNNNSIYSILNKEFRFLNPVKFEEMIHEWEHKCTENKCNYLAIEYPEFAKPGGYQLAINAKPLFIQKALKLCKTKNVLYIDGDMTINRYPEIFDMKDVDFMARGWWIDPRSSYKMDESITYDPYTFETSGGTMFFSQSTESSQLINYWIKESEKPYQKGKADDRILSLIFNSKKFLLNMKIIQLPIEYLWLSLDYDDRILENIYDYNVAKMRETIYIEHPECLTSEDTAVGAGASSDRTPKFYSFLEDLSPVSENIHEYIMFPSKDMAKSFDSYFNDMNSISYIDDGNKILYEKGLVQPGKTPDKNEQPLYVTRYDDKFGNKQINYDGEQYSRNEMSIINYKRAEKMILSNVELIKTENNIIEIQNADNKLKEIELIPLIIRLLLDGNSVIYNPINQQGYDSNNYNILKQNLETRYKNLDFIFSPMITGNHRNDFYRPKILTNQAILFTPHNKILIDLLSIFISFEQLSDYFNEGTYEFMSRLRIGYVFKPAKKSNVFNFANNETTGGNNSELNKWIEEYNNGLDMMYCNGVKKHRTIPKTIKSQRRMYTKTRKTHRKSHRKTLTRR